MLAWLPCLKRGKRTILHGKWKHCLTCGKRGSHFAFMDLLNTFCMFLWWAGQVGSQQWSCSWVLAGCNHTQHNISFFIRHPSHLEGHFELKYSQLQLWHYFSTHIAHFCLKDYQNLASRFIYPAITWLQKYEGHKPFINCFNLGLNEQNNNDLPISYCMAI